MTMGPILETPRLPVPPGDPERLQDLGNALGALAEVMDGISDGYREAAQSSDAGLWEGLAGQAFRIRVAETRRAVDIAGEQFRNGAAALRTFADALHTAQGRVRIAQADAVQAAEYGAFAKSRLDLLTSQGDVISPARIRLREEIDRAADDLRRAQGNADSAMQDLHGAVLRFVGALAYAKDAAQALPPVPAGVTPTESVTQFLQRQAGDVFNPFKADDDQSSQRMGRAVFDLAAGATLGPVEHFHTIAKDHWVITQPGTVTPKFVRGHYRTTPNGGRIWIGPYVRVHKTPPKVINDVAKRFKSARIAGWATPIGGVISGTSAAYDQMLNDSERPDLDGGDRVSRMIGAGFVRGATSTAGSFVVGNAGRGIGIFIGGLGAAPTGPGVGAGVLIGGTIGGTLGSIYGGSVGDALGKKLTGLMIK
jgi:hypothetical protein